MVTTTRDRAGLIRRVGRARRLACLILIVAIAGGSTTVHAQAPQLPASAAIAAAADAATSPVRLLVGRSTVLDVGSPIARVSLTSADVADALVTSPSQLLINGKQPGTISMFVWDRAGQLRRYEVSVQRDLGRLSEQMRELFPNEQISVQSNGKNIVLTGTASSKDVMEKAVNVAAGYVGSAAEVTTLLQLQAGAPSNQVLLKVRFAEVSRSAMSELGASFAANGLDNGRWFGRTTTGQFPAPEWDGEGKLVFSDFLNLFLLDGENHLTTVIRALSNRGLFQSLAEPNLVAESGKEASFLAGGEFPIPVVQGTGANTGISVVFKEFGIRLNFTPTVNGNRVHLKVRPEVSTLDFGNGVVLDGFRIPALTTRRTETELELNNGQTFAIAGLMNNTVASTMQKIPGIGDIPILGYLFRSKQAQKNLTELVVMITPQILPNNSSGVTSEMPRTLERYIDPAPQNRTQPQPPPAFTPERQSNRSSQTPATAAADTSKPAAAPADPAAAAAAVSALTPNTPRVVASPAPAPAANAAPVAEAPLPVGSTASRPLTKEEKKAMERARKDEEERLKREAEANAKAAAIVRKNEMEQRKRDEKAAREQAKLDEQMAKKQAEEAKKQAERDREHQKEVEAAAARLKAAEAAYNAQLAKQGKQ
jgi:pilus assembly protein CpaC